MSDILIEYIKVDIAEYLRSEIAKRDTDTDFIMSETRDYNSQEIQNIIISNMTRK
jgi:hypothetical protein